jgi:hypothetical protein
MAGQPSEPSYQPAEPSFQPAGQDHNLTQGRPAWQQPPAYNPPANGASQPGGGQHAGGQHAGGQHAGGQQGYGAPAYGAPDQGYAAPPPDRGYPGQEHPGYNAGEQTYVAPPLEQQPGYPGADQGYGDPAYQGQGTGQGYPGYQSAGYGAQPGQGAASVPPPQWQANPSPARPQSSGEKGFVGSLLDFSFSSFVTPKIIKLLYRLFTAWTALVAIIVAIIGFRFYGFLGGVVVLILDAIFVLLSLGIYRVVLEAFMVVHRIYDETRQIREQGAASSVSEH